MAQQGNAFTGYNASTEQLPRFSPEQQNLINSLMPLLQQGLQQKTDFAPIAENARRNFNTKTIPSIAERFTAMGGGQRSGAFQGALGQAGADLESNLAALGSQHGFQQQQQLQNLLGHALSPSFDNIYLPSSPGIAHGLAGDASAGIGDLLTQFLPGWLGNLFKGFSSLFGGNQKPAATNRLGGSVLNGISQGYNQVQGS